MTLRGAIAAALTPLRDGGEALDEAAFPAYVRFLAEGDDGTVPWTRHENAPCAEPVHEEVVGRVVPGPLPQGDRGSVPPEVSGQRGVPCDPPDEGSYVGEGGASVGLSSGPLMGCHDRPPVDTPASSVSRVRSVPSGRTM